MSWAMWWIKASARRADAYICAPEREEEEDFLTQLEREQEALPEEKRTAPGRPSAMASWRVDEPRGGERVEGSAELG
jgi:hypothetical protein